MKLITLKFRSKCRSCGSILAAGTRAWYGGTGAGVTCVACKSKSGNYSPSVATPPAAQVGKSARLKETSNCVWSIDWADAKRFLLAATAGNIPLASAMNRSRVSNDLRGGDWAGFTAGQLNRWLKTGYQTDAIKGLNVLAPIREKRRTLYVEDGDELHVDRALSGEDNFMSRDTKRMVIPGVKLNIELDASAGSSAALFAYQAWIARTIYALEMAGVDPEIEIFTLSRRLFHGQKGIARTAVRLKKEGEIMDFASISPMLSPAAFRGIMFSLFSVQAEAQGFGTPSGYGSGVTDTWSVAYNPASESIDVSCHWDSDSFPESRMTEQFKSALEAMRKGY